MWLLGFELRTFGRAVGCSYPLSHLTSPQLSVFYVSVCVSVCVWRGGGERMHREPRGQPGVIPQELSTWLLEALVSESQ
jgi:hypothetical protein